MSENFEEHSCPTMHENLEEIMEVDKRTIKIKHDIIDGNKLQHDVNDQTEIVPQDEVVNSDSQSSLKVNTSFTKLEKTITESDDLKCDMYSSVDVENVTNSLAEKVNKDDIPDEERTECDIDNTVVNEETDKTLAAENLINQVNTLDISGGNQDISINKSRDKSTVILNQESDSLKNLLTYESSSEDESESDQISPLRVNEKSVTVSDSVDSEEDSESSNEDDDDDNDDDDDDDEEDEPIKHSSCTKRNSKNIMIGDKDQRETPFDNMQASALPELDINVEGEEFQEIGYIDSVIDTLVTVQAIAGTPAMDIDTYLFIKICDEMVPLGLIEDVLGAVLVPLYCIQAQSKIRTDVTRGMSVYCAPKSKYTKYIFVSELMKQRGTDASWVGDAELPPEIAAELSDDDLDPVSDDPNGARKAYKRKHNSRERHRQFVENMNRCNTINNQVAQFEDAQQSRFRRSRFHHHVQRGLFTDIMEQNRLPPAFNPNVPPPGFPPLPMRNHGVAPLPDHIGSCNFEHLPDRFSRYPAGFEEEMDGRYCNMFMGYEARHYGPGSSSHPH